VAEGQAGGYTVAEQLESCVNAGILTREEAKQVEAYDALRYDAILTDSFEHDYLVNRAAGSHEDVSQQSRVA
jgi:acyl-CoA dehydrogenase